MNYAQRTIWAQLIASTLGVATYLAIVLPQLATLPVGEIAWQWPMIWCCLGAIALSILLSIGAGIVAGMVDRDEEHRADQRDREIERVGTRVGQGVASLGVVVGLALTMFELPWFWIGTALFLGAALGALVGGVVSLVAYRRGLI